MTQVSTEHLIIKTKSGDHFDLTALLQQFQAGSGAQKQYERLSNLTHFNKLILTVVQHAPTMESLPKHVQMLLCILGVSTKSKGLRKVFQADHLQSLIKSITLEDYYSVLISKKRLPEQLFDENFKTKLAAFNNVRQLMKNEKDASVDLNPIASDIDILGDDAFVVLKYIKQKDLRKNIADMIAKRGFVLASQVNLPTNQANIVAKTKNESELASEQAILDASLLEVVSFCDQYESHLNNYGYDKKFSNAVFKKTIDYAKTVDSNSTLKRITETLRFSLRQLLSKLVRNSDPSVDEYFSKVEAGIKFEILKALLGKNKTIQIVKGTLPTQTLSADESFQSLIDDCITDNTLTSRNKNLLAIKKTAVNDIARNGLQASIATYMIAKSLSISKPIDWLLQHAVMGDVASIAKLEDLVKNNPKLIVKIHLIESISLLLKNNPTLTLSNLHTLLGDTVYGWYVEQTKSSSDGVLWELVKDELDSCTDLSAFFQRFDEPDLQDFLIHKYCYDTEIGLSGYYRNYYYEWNKELNDQIRDWCLAGKLKFSWLRETRESVYSWEDPFSVNYNLSNLLNADVQKFLSIEGNDQYIHNMLLARDVYFKMLEVHDLYIEISMRANDEKFQVEKALYHYIAQHADWSDLESVKRSVKTVDTFLQSDYGKLLAKIGYAAEYLPKYIPSLPDFTNQTELEAWHNTVLYNIRTNSARSSLVHKLHALALFADPAFVANGLEEDVPLAFHFPVFQAA